MTAVNRDQTFNNYYPLGPSGVGRTHKVMHLRATAPVTRASGIFASDQSFLVGAFKPKWWNPFQFTREDIDERLEAILGPKDL